jgi:hypothetical protein
MAFSSIPAGTRWLAPLAMALACLGTPAAAQSVPRQEWYPEGYLDLRTAAAEQVATFPRDEAALLTTDSATGSKKYNLIDCEIGPDVADGFEGASWRHQALALEIASKRAELQRLGFLPEIYEQPLLDYERKALAAIAAADEIYNHWLDNPPDVDIPPGGGPVAIPRPELPRADYAELIGALEAGRERLQPDRPGFMVQAGCPYGLDEVLNTGIAIGIERGPDDGFTFHLRPRNGELRLINAFAFQVCARKVADPWQDPSCRWSNYSDGEYTARPGRYLYEARWPDGTVQRGAKILERDARGKFTTHTFNRN